MPQPHRFVLHGHRASRAARTRALRTRLLFRLGQPHLGGSTPFGREVLHGPCILLFLSQRQHIRLGVKNFGWPVRTASHRRAVLTRPNCSMLLCSLLLLALCGSSAPFGGQGMFVLRDARSFDKHHSALSPFAAAVPKGIARPTPLSHHVWAG